MSEADQVEFFQVTLADYDKGLESLDKLAQAWLHGDEEMLNDLIFSAFRKHDVGKKLYQLIFVERNIQMLNAIEGYMKSSQKIFLVVGIGHMLEDDGLVALLEKKGYQVSQVDTRVQH